MSKRNIKKIISLIAVIICLLYTIFGTKIVANLEKSLGAEEHEKTKQVTNIENGNLKIYFIDVGQADSILIQDNDKFGLIDAGNNEDGELLVNYLKSLGVENLSFAVGTHAHEDHIGGMDDIITNFNIDTFYMPDAITTTKTFEDVLDALTEKNLSITVPEVDKTFNLNDAKFTCLYTGVDTSDLNNTSIVLKLVYGNTSYLFMGDATSTTEKKILSKDLKSDVLKVGHHGSQYSTTEAFLNKVNPDYAIISVGKNNIYKHPKEVTLEKLEQRNIKIYRTDEEGTVILTSDGNDISITTEKTNTNG